MPKVATLTTLEVELAGGGAVIFPTGKWVSLHRDSSPEILQGHLVAHVYLDQVCDVFHGSALIFLEAGKIAAPRETD